MNVDNLHSILLYLNENESNLFRIVEILEVVFPSNQNINIDAMMKYLVDNGYVDRTNQNLYRISIVGQQFLNNGSFYKEENERKEEKRISELTTEKLETDLKNAKRIYESYPLTKALAWIGAICGAVALILKIIEMCYK